ncbi:hypothetical protein AB0I35_18925 [Nocardia sp. NPDC050378]|uniref:hypothetical protein n=1 Tax=Nocardia sp. NPDC050378 TaxID=3155400 RepID=UPI0033F42BA4
MTPLSRRFALVASLAVLFAPACASSGDSTPTPAPTNTRPESTGPGVGRPFTADPNLVDPRPLPFPAWRRVGDATIAVDFQTGNPQCNGVDATVTETADTVTVALRAGTPADAVGRMCTMEAVLGTLEITLDAPLGSRQVLDAA